MSKRIYLESAKKWAIKAGIPAVGSIFLIFMYINSLGIIDSVQYSGDTICAGTLDDPCYAYLNLSFKEDVFIYPVEGVPDPWGRDTLFNFDPNVKSWKLERSWGKGWREIPLDKTCTGTWCGAKDSSGCKYSIAFREGRNYQLRITGYKKSPYDIIKWGAFSGVDEIDPSWFGIDRDIGYKEKSEITYTPSTDTICNNGECSLSLYSGIRNVYEDNTWKRIEDAKSLKGSDIECVVDFDGEYMAECLDYNYTHKKIKFKINKNENKNKDIPIKNFKISYNETTGKKIKEKIKEKKIKFKDLGEEIVLWIESEFGDELHFGENSTVIELHDPDTEILDDSYGRKSAADTNYGSDISMSITTGATEARSYIKFNLSAIPPEAIINSAVLRLRLASLDGYASSHNVSVFHVYDSTWNESSITWNNQPCGVNFDDSGNCNLTSESNTTYDDRDGDSMMNWDTTQMVTAETGNNISMVLTKDGTSGMLGPRTKENAYVFGRPWLNIDYSLPDTIKPTYSNAQTNTTIAGESILFSILYNDDTALESDGGYIFSTNNSGVWVNDSLIIWTSTPQWANVSKTLPNAGNRTDYRWYANDSAGNINNTEIFYVEITAGDTCTYSSGTWAVNFIDNCSITENVNLAGENLTLHGDVGRFDIRAVIANYDKIIKHGDGEIAIWSGGSITQ